MKGGPELRGIDLIVVVRGVAKDTVPLLHTCFSSTSSVGLMARRLARFCRGIEKVGADFEPIPMISSARR